MWLRAGALIAFALLLFVFVTVVALEASGVVTVTTIDPAGQPRTTRIWFIATDTQLLLEAGHPMNPWMRDLSRQRIVTLAGAGLDGSYTTTLDSGVEARLAIRRAMRDKYGWRDAWVALIFDTSQSGRVQLSAIK